MNGLMVAGVVVRQDADGRYSLNDLHRAAGSEKRHQPSDFMRRNDTKELCDEIARSGNSRNEPVVVIQGGADQGTFVCKELVYAYAMWISQKFHLLVIRAFDALVNSAALLDTDDGDYRANADQVVSAGRVFRTLYSVGRSMGLARKMAATRANQGAVRLCGVDLAAEIGAASALNEAELTPTQRYVLELEDRIRNYFDANGWLNNFRQVDLRKALGLGDDHRTQQAVGNALARLGYGRCKIRLGPHTQCMGYELRVDRPPLPSCA